MLEAMGCDVLQGYLICPPLPERDFVAWLQQRADHSQALPLNERSA